MEFTNLFDAKSQFTTSTDEYHAFQVFV